MYTCGYDFHRCIYIPGTEFMKLQTHSNSKSKHVYIKTFDKQVLYNMSLLVLEIEETSVQHYVRKYCVSTQLPSCIWSLVFDSQTIKSGTHIMKIVLKRKGKPPATFTVNKSYQQLRLATLTGMCTCCHLGLFQRVRVVC